MNLNQLIAALIFAGLFSTQGCSDKNKNSTTPEPVNKDTLKTEAWQMEERYWDYVQQNDTVSYKKLWHEDFIGYPSFGDGVSGKSGIASWIPKLHEDSSRVFSYTLYKKAVNVIDDVVIVFYDADETWTEKATGKVSRNDRLKFTHTWKKYPDGWLILGGMAALKIPEQQ